MSDIGPQVPRTDSAPHTGATNAISSMAYRDSDVSALVGLNDGTGWSAGRMESLFKPNLGEAFCQAVISRCLGKTRDPLVPSYGAEPRTIIEHCLEGEEIRRERDRKLTWIALGFGLLFLPGTLLWLAAYVTGHERYGRGSARSRSGLRAAIQIGTVVLALALIWHFRGGGGLGGIYLQLMIPVPLIGWFWAKRICLATAQQLHQRWAGVLDGVGGGPRTSRSVPLKPEDAEAANLREQLARIAAEQDSNIAHYAGPKGVLGMGRRWATWTVAEQLDGVDGSDEFRPFRPYDVVRRMEGRLNALSKSPLVDGGIPSVRVKHFVVSAIGEGADKIGRADGPDMDGYSLRGHAVESVANKQSFGGGPRHYLATQFVLWQGQLVVTMLSTVTVLAQTLRVEVAGHALGPLPGLFYDKPSAPSKTVSKTSRPWETRKVTLPLVHNEEVVRLAVRAAFTHFEWSVSLLRHLGGTLKLPEPFGLRSAWAAPSWGNRFMADDAIRVAAPVLRAVHAGMLDLLEYQDVELGKFEARVGGLSGEVQGVRPSRADEYDAG